jgi:hypothetical protein
VSQGSVWWRWGLQGSQCARVRRVVALNLGFPGRNAFKLPERRVLTHDWDVACRMIEADLRHDAVLYFNNDAVNPDG